LLELQRSLLHLGLHLDRRRTRRLELLRTRLRRRFSWRFR
jgi:hypothetical protein